MDQSIANIVGIKGPSVAPTSNVITPPKPPKPQHPQAQAYREMGFLFVQDLTPGDPVIEKFHVDAAKAIQEEQSKAWDAVRALEQSSAMKDEYRTARIAGVLQLASAALFARLQGLAKPLLARIDAAEKMIQAAMNREPADPAKAMLWLAKVEAVRRQLDTMEDVGDRIKAASDMATRGDETWAEVFTRSIKPYIPPMLAGQFSLVYQAAVAGDQVKVIEDAGPAIAEIRQILQNASLAISSMAGGRGLGTEWASIGVDQIARSWPEATRQAFVAAYGVEAFEAKLEGKGSMADLLGFFRPGLKGA